MIDINVHMHAWQCKGMDWVALAMTLESQMSVPRTRREGLKTEAVSGFGKPHQCADNTAQTIFKPWYASSHSSHEYECVSPQIQQSLLQHVWFYKSDDLLLSK